VVSGLGSDQALIEAAGPAVEAAARDLKGEREERRGKGRQTHAQQQESHACRIAYIERALTTIKLSGDSESSSGPTKPLLLRETVER